MANANGRVVQILGGVVDVEFLADDIRIICTSQTTVSGHDDHKRAFWFRALRQKRMQLAVPGLTRHMR